MEVAVSNLGSSGRPDTESVELRTAILMLPLEVSFANESNRRGWMNGRPDPYAQMIRVSILIYAGSRRGSSAVRVTEESAFKKT